MDTDRLSRLTDVARALEDEAAARAAADRATKEVAAAIHRAQGAGWSLAEIGRTVGLDRRAVWRLGRVWSLPPDDL